VTDASRSWKIIQASQVKSVQKRSRNLESVFGFGIFDTPSAESRAEGHHRRASRHYMALGAPYVPQQRHSLANSGMSLGHLRRMEAEQDVVAARMEIRRNREHSAAMRLLEEEHEEEEEGVGASREMRSRTSSNGHGGRQSFERPGPGQRVPQVPSGGYTIPRVTNEPDRRQSSQVRDLLPRFESPPVTSATPSQSRPPPGRLGILAARQSRGRGTGGTREAPLVLLSDDE
jgi:hypothetical protein